MLRRFALLFCLIFFQTCSSIVPFSFPFFLFSFFTFDSLFMIITSEGKFFFFQKKREKTCESIKERESSQRAPSSYLSLSLSLLWKWAGKIEHGILVL